MKTYLTGWNFMRLLRLVLAMIILVQGVIVKDWTFFVMGGFLALMAFLNIGCCGVNGCSVPTKKNNATTTNEIHYEEVGRS